MNPPPHRCFCATSKGLSRNSRIGPFIGEQLIKRFVTSNPSRAYVGRALQTKGRASDHGWGGHNIVAGGAVQDRKLYGAWPSVTIGGPEDAGQGRLIPTTSLDQSAATLCSWFGADSSQLASVLPNLSRFPAANLGFLG